MAFDRIGVMESNNENKVTSTSKSSTHWTEHTLDPNDWDEFRALAHRMVDDIVGYLSTLRERPPWQPMPAEVRRSFSEPLPLGGVGEERAYEEFVRKVLPYPNGNLHPRFFGWVQGNGTPMGMMADMLASAMNPHMAGFDQAPARVEQQVIDWLAKLMGFPAGAGGVLVTGGTMANLLGLAVARHAGAGFSIREEGLQGHHARLLAYASEQTHGWVQKAAELLGLGRSAVRLIPTGEDYRVNVEMLAAAVREDRNAGHKPFCVVGTVGTVNTGATDDLSALAGLCKEEGLWLHVDGAYGALVRLSDQLCNVADGIERADSIGFDLHKWGYLPFECACILVRDGALQREAFASSPVYLGASTRGVIAGGLPFADRGIDLTRGFKALKVWMSFKAYGAKAIGRLIEQNVDQAMWFAEKVESIPELELLAPTVLNIVCFRYRPSSSEMSVEELNEINKEILLRIQEQGIAVPSSTLLRGNYAIRVCLVNHRTRREDLAALLEGTLRIGKEFAGEYTTER